MRRLRLMQACITVATALLAYGLAAGDLTTVLFGLGGVSGAGAWLMQHRLMRIRLRRAGWTASCITCGTISALEDDRELSARWLQQGTYVRRSLMQVLRWSSTHRRSH
jgi:hypothetical protein